MQDLNTGGLKSIFSFTVVFQNEESESDEENNTDQEQESEAFVFDASKFKHV